MWGFHTSVGAAFVNREDMMRGSLETLEEVVAEERVVVAFVFETGEGLRLRLFGDSRRTTEGERRCFLEDAMDDVGEIGLDGSGVREGELAWVGD
jgi:hypothetical protein